MANYEEKKVYYIPAFVERIDELGNYPVKVSFPIGEERLAVQLEDLPDLMFTAEEVAKENDLYTSLHGEVVVVTENKELKEKVASLQEENCNLTAWYKEANKTASEAADANDELKAKIAFNKGYDEGHKEGYERGKADAAISANILAKRLTAKFDDVLSVADVLEELETLEADAKGE